LCAVSFHGAPVIVREGAKWTALGIYGGRWVAWAAKVIVIDVFLFLARSSPQTDKAEPRRFPGVLGVVAAWREILLPAL
jgi:hypothetical protein